MPKPATARGEATLRRLLDAAEAEFGERGFHAASVSSITARAKVSQGTFYLYFPSKEAIFGAVVRAIGHALRKHMALAVAQRSDRMQAQRAGIEAFLDFVQRHPGLYRIVQEAQFVDEVAFREYYERLAAGYARSLARDAAAGALAPGDAEVRAWAIMGLGHFLGLRYCLWRQRLPEPEVLDAAMAFIGHGIAPHESGPP
ncbi:TetR/AcrR family transcriptional regulator [Sinimarinibacterium thermocellulolyticum]|uniref:TetR/AcrR family transcriptional regulator n=1 Tax=Sinimarinibacterium thermocellulolyticum TaxID=3170016 RepID=A0ABV2AB04_9GAMM